MKPLAMVAVAATLALASCGGGTPEPDPSSPQYRYGYEEGLEEGKTSKCAEIESFSENMIEALRENGICG